MICYICDADNWHSMGQLHTKSEILVCKGCGNVAHRVDPSKEAEMKAYYRRDYRKRIGFANLLTTTNKQNYVQGFLRDYLEAHDPEKTGKRLTVVDIGCATGYIPAFFRRLGHRATGTEWTITMRRFAEHYYGIPVTEDLETKRQYDLVVMHHTLEHFMEPDKKLAAYVAALAPGGHLLVSLPEWFDALEECSGSDMVDFEHLFHKDHINVFSAQSAKNLFAKAGLVVVKEDHFTYGQTYLLRRPEAGEEVAGRVNESWEGQAEKLTRAKAAIEKYQRGDYQAARSLWVKFPEAWLKLILEVHGKDPESQRVMWGEVKEVLPENARVFRALATWLYRMDEHEKAIHVIEQLLERKPTADVFVWYGWALAEIGRPREAMRAMERAATLDPTKWAECHDWIANLAAKMPTWDERAEAEYKDAMFAKQGLRPILADSAMGDPVEPATAPAPTPEAAPA